MVPSRVPMHLAALGSALQPKTLRPFFSLVLLMAGAAVAGQQKPSPSTAGGSEDQATLTVRADSQQKDKQTNHMRGHVQIAYQAMKLQADEATFDEVSGDVSARGHVLFLDPESHIAADEVHYNVRTRKGWFANGLGYVHPRIRPRPGMLTTSTPFYFHATKVERLDEDTYLVEHGHLTSCECEAKGWSVSAGRAKVEVDNRLYSRDAVLRLLQMPVFYTPVMVNSIQQDPRQTGFLLPNMGDSSQKGVIIGDGFFWAINPSADLLVGGENFSIRGPEGRADFNARPSSDSDIIIDWYGVDDRGGGVDRETKAPGQSLVMVGKDNDLFAGFRGVLNIDYITSLAFRETWTDNFTQAVNSEARQMGFLTKNFDAYSLNIYVSRYQDFFSASTGPGNSVAILQTPSISFSGDDKQVGDTPFYFNVEASAGAVGRTEPGLTLPIAQRLDFYPQLVLRTKAFWGFHLTPTFGARATSYGTSLNADHSPLERLLADFTLDLRPPSLEKILAKTYKGRRIKHVIEPDIQYRLVRVRDSEDVADVVRYDDLDIFAETNEIEYSLTNTLLARKDAPDGTGDTPQAREIFSWRIAQKYYFDPTFGGAVQPGTETVVEPTISLTGFAFPEGNRLSPVDTVMKFAPFSNYDTELRADFSPNGGGVLNAGITSHIKRGPLGLAFTDFFISKTEGLTAPVVSIVPASQLPSFHLLRVVATFGDVNRKGLSGALGMDYNLGLHTTNQAVVQAGYNFGCFGLDFEYRRFALGTLRRENEFRAALSLANVGTFGNMKRRDRLY